VSSKLEYDILEGGWRALCCGLLIQTVNRLAAESNLFSKHSKSRATGGQDKELMHQRQDARRWIEGGTGTIQFEECCDALGVCPVRAREKILEYCDRTKRLRSPPVLEVRP